eukprot:gene11941-25021_t
MKLQIFLIGYILLRSLSSSSTSTKNNTCPSKSPMPMWSWALAWLCCDVYPNVIGKFKPPFEGGYKLDGHYFYQKNIQNEHVVYISSADFPSFINVFLALPRNFRIVLVTGLDDIGIPWEIFHPNRSRPGYQTDFLWPAGQPVSMRQFINDLRLLRWYTQNYDLLGCTSYYCSDVTLTLPADRALVNKIVPIPIGMDFHSRGMKGVERGLRPVPWIIGTDVWASSVYTHPSPSAHLLRNTDRAFLNKGTVCDQRMEMDVLLNSFQPFHLRPVAIVAAFVCDFRGSLAEKAGRQDTRGQLCSLLKQHSQQQQQHSQQQQQQHVAHTSSQQMVMNITITHLNGGMYTRRLFWKQLGTHAFSLAPAGHGLDTHRVWEILNMHSVPIVLSSSLDSLYALFPVVIVKDWNDVFHHDALQGFKVLIQERFGLNPFASLDVRKKLTVQYWKDLIRNDIILNQTTTHMN